MDKSYKNLKISPKLHREIKVYCANLGIKLNEWVEKQLQDKIQQLKDEEKVD